MPCAAIENKSVGMDAPLTGMMFQQRPCHVWAIGRCWIHWSILAIGDANRMQRAIPSQTSASFVGTQSWMVFQDPPLNLRVMMTPSAAT